MDRCIRGGGARSIVPKPVVAILGRPNVGKSTLFNRIVGGRVAIVEGEPGVTRDRLYQDAEWAGRIFTLVDTGGLDFQESGEIIEGVRQQVELAVRESDAVLFVVDARSGLNPDDLEIALMIRKANKPVVLVANKVERFDQPSLAYDFYQLGLGDPVPVSAAEGLNTGDMLDRLVELLPEVTAEEYEADVIKIAVVGRPNVGKSSLVNSILGEERVIVSSVPGTTRDAIDTAFERDGRHYVIIDTAGMRRRGRIGRPMEKYSVIRALRAVDRSDVVLIVNCNGSLNALPVQPVNAIMSTMSGKISADGGRGGGHGQKRKPVFSCSGGYLAGGYSKNGPGQGITPARRGCYSK